MNKPHKHLIIAVSICIACLLAISAHLLKYNITSFANSMAREGSVSSNKAVNGYGALFIALILAGMLIAVIHSRRK